MRVRPVAAQQRRQRVAVHRHNHDDCQCDVESQYGGMNLSTTEERPEIRITAIHHQKLVRDGDESLPVRFDL